MSHPMAPAPGPWPDRDLARHILWSSWELVIAIHGSLECHSSWKNPPEAYQKPPLERAHVVVSQKMYASGQTTTRLKSL